MALQLENWADIIGHCIYSIVYESHFQLLSNMATQDIVAPGWLRLGDGMGILPHPHPYHPLVTTYTLEREIHIVWAFCDVSVINLYTIDICHPGSSVEVDYKQRQLVLFIILYIYCIHRV